MTKENTSNCLTLTASEVKTILEFVLESRLPFVMWGVKAVGKTTIVNDFAKEHGYRLVTLHLATQDVVDLIGMMAKVPEETDAAQLRELWEKSTMGHNLTEDEYNWVKNTIHSNKLKTVWTRPEWLSCDPDLKTIYFLDEFNRGNKFVMAAMLPFLNEGRLHQHKIGPNDVVIAACNPSTGKYSVNDAFEHDEALKDRCGHIILAPTREEFLDYASNKFGPVTAAVLKKHTKYTELETFDLPFKIEPSRRSLVNVMQFVDKKDNRWIRRNGRLVMGCYLGTEFLHTWWEARFKKDVYLEIDDLIKFDQNRQRISDSISAVVDGVDTVKPDIFEASVDTIIQWVDTEYKDGVTRLDWMFKYFSLQFIPKDSIVAMLGKIDVMSYPYLLEAFYDSKLLDHIPEIKETEEFTKTLEGIKA
jgi:MoxR-like ATPase